MLMGSGDSIDSTLRIGEVGKYRRETLIGQKSYQEVIFETKFGFEVVMSNSCSVAMDHGYLNYFSGDIWESLILRCIPNRTVLVAN